MRRFALWPLLVLFLSGCAGRAKNKDKVDAESATQPKLLAPSVRKIWKPAKMAEGGLEWEEGHYIYRIERNSSWSR
jgi:PBP1b-binding outer membrane lipoprotein LpoB